MSHANTNSQTILPVKLDEPGLPGAKEAQDQLAATDSASPPGSGELGQGMEQGNSTAEAAEISRRGLHHDGGETGDSVTPGAGRSASELARGPLAVALDAPVDTPRKSECPEAQPVVTCALPKVGGQEAGKLDGSIEGTPVCLGSEPAPQEFSHGPEDAVTAGNLAARETTINNAPSQPRLDQEEQAKAPLASNAPLQRAAHECARTDAKISVDAADGNFARFNPLSGQIDPRNAVADPNQHVQRVIEALQAKDVQLGMMLEHIAQAAGGTAPAVVAAAERIVAGFDALHHRLANLETIMEARTRNARNYQVGG